MIKIWCGQVHREYLKTQSDWDCREPVKMGWGCLDQSLERAETCTGSGKQGASKKAEEQLGVHYMVLSG